MSDDYEYLKSRYNAVVHENERLTAECDRLRKELVAWPAELSIIVCDGKCGRAVAGFDEAQARKAAVAQGWSDDRCAACRPKTGEA